jgi:hypothetical protein
MGQTVASECRRPAVWGRHHREVDVMCARRLAITALLLITTTAAPGQPVSGDVIAAGFQTAGGNVVRPGQWFPVLAALRVEGDAIFTGEVRVEALDLDGDLVAYTRTGVTVDGASGLERVWCYVASPTHARNLPRQLQVVAVDEEGRPGALRARLDLPPLNLLQDREMLLLDISRDRIAGLNALTTSGWTPGYVAAAQCEYYREVVTATLPNGPQDFPDSWVGLEAVDVVIWDKPDPSQDFTTFAQLDALIEWVQSGGQLVVGVGENWNQIRGTRLAEIMPLTGIGKTTQVDSLRVFREHIARTGADESLRNPIPLVDADLAPGAMRTLGDVGPDGALNLITMRLVGAGRVVAVAASLNDLVRNAQPDMDRLCGALFDLNELDRAYRDKLDEQGMYGVITQHSVYEDVAGAVGFQAATALRGLTALIFIIGYVALATLGSWWWLRSRKLETLNWTVFAAFAVAASVFSLVTVRALRGFSSVQTLCVLDLDPTAPLAPDTVGEATAARGPCLFGYRSPTRRFAELELPTDRGFLRPMAADPRRESLYVTPARYASYATQQVLEPVLVRATLKQLEGYWSGQVTGTLTGALTLDRTTGRVTPDSYIFNNLDADLAGAYLLFIDPRQVDVPAGRPWSPGAVPWRVAGMTRLYDHAALVTDVPPAMSILALRLPAIPAGQRAAQLGAGHYRAVDEAWVDWRNKWDRRPPGNADAQTRMRLEMPDLRTLWEVQQAWSGDVYGRSLRAGLPEPVMGVLLGSTLSYYLPTRGSDLKTPGRPVRTEGLPNLDLMHWMMRGNAVLIAWSREPGPAVIESDGNPLPPGRGITVYRVRLPVRYQGNPLGPREGLGS